MNQQAKKEAVGRAAVRFVEPGGLLGVGTGSTANCFIDAMAEAGLRLEAAVASSVATAQRLESHGYRVVDLTEVDALPLYVDGADEATRSGALIKGGGGALTREKIVAEASASFLCLIDDSKLVERLGAFPLPIEVIPLAVRLVTRRLEALGGQARLREGFVSDNGNPVLDVTGLALDDPVALEERLNQLPGIVTHGIFARRGADRLLVGDDRGVTTLEADAEGAAR